MNKFKPLIPVTDDGLLIPIVRQWSEEKYKLVGFYCDIFTTGMKNKWSQLVYIDLFAGAGYAEIQETGKKYMSSSLIAMSVPIPFSKYILCEQDPAKFDALQSRVNKHFPSLNVELINGDSNAIIDSVRKALPSYGKGNTMLPFCFVDPYSLNLHFKTIETLGSHNLMDFLILQALHMDGNRNLTKYIKEENEKIALYLGNEKWRDDFNNQCNQYSSNFVRFLADQYLSNMTKMEYKDMKNMHQIRSNDKNLPLYYLSFYSKHTRGVEFFQQVEKRVKPQLSLDF